MHLANDQASLTLAKKDHQIEHQHNQILLLEEIQSHRDEMEQQLLQGQQSRVELSEQLQAIKQDQETLRTEDQQHTKNLKEELEHLQSERNEFQSNCVDKDVKIKSLMQTNLDLQAQIS
jgi:hypothetical protein